VAFFLNVLRELLTEKRIVLQKRCFQNMCLTGNYRVLGFLMLGPRCLCVNTNHSAVRCHFLIGMFPLRCAFGPCFHHDYPFGRFLLCDEKVKFCCHSFCFVVLILFPKLIGSFLMLQ